MSHIGGRFRPVLARGFRQRPPITLLRRNLPFRERGSCDRGTRYDTSAMPRPALHCRSSVSLPSADRSALARMVSPQMRWLMPKFRSAKVAAPAVARRLLRFVTDEHQSGWSVAISGDQKGTHVHGKWHVTNLSDQNVAILEARI